MVHVAEATNCFTVEYCLTAGNDWICRTCIDEEGSRGLMTDEIASGIRADAVPLTAVLGGPFEICGMADEDEDRRSERKEYFLRHSQPSQWVEWRNTSARPQTAPGTS